MNFIFLGSPGVGKGTYASRVKIIFGIPSISTGDMLRAAVKNQTELGISAKDFMDKGELVPDEIVIGLIRERIKDDDCKNGFILDGFPRTIRQAEELNASSVKIDAVINFKSPRDIIIQRLSGRRICKRCQEIWNTVNLPPKEKGICDKCKGELYQRDDDKPEAINERLEVYENQTAPLIEFYRKMNLLQEVDAGKLGIGKDINPEIIEDTIAIMEKFAPEAQ